MKPFKDILSSVFKKVSCKQKIDGFSFYCKSEISSNLAFKPRQFRCIILCLKSMSNSIKERVIIHIILDTLIFNCLVKSMTP